MATAYIFWQGYNGEINLTVNNIGHFRTHTITPSTYARFCRIADSGRYRVSHTPIEDIGGVTWHMTVPNFSRWDDVPYSRPELPAEADGNILWAI